VFFSQAITVPDSRIVYESITYQKSLRQDNLNCKFFRHHVVPVAGTAN
jgi:hypothetical protein